VRFLADESCDFGVVSALRAAGHDVTAVVELSPGADDEAVLAWARSEARVLLTEDKDFGLLAYAHAHETTGVVLIRFPAGSRSALGQTVVDVVQELGNRLVSAFVVVEPGRARISRPHLEDPIGRGSSDN
jgi:predicted nuclease of predicted toxin-antitoxin system